MSPKEHHTEPAGRRLPDEEPSAAAEVSRLRRAVEERSALPLLVLHHAPGWVLPVAVVGVFFSGLLLTGIATTVAVLLGLGVLQSGIF